MALKNIRFHYGPESGRDVGEKRIAFKIMQDMGHEYFLTSGVFNRAAKNPGPADNEEPLAGFGQKIRNRPEGRGRGSKTPDPGRKTQTVIGGDNPIAAIG